MGLVCNIQVFSAIQKQRVLQSKKHFFLSGGISEDDVEEIIKIKTIHPIIGIDINSRFELPSLKKDRAKIKSLIKKI